MIHASVRSFRTVIFDSSTRNQQNHFRGILLWLGILVAAMNLIPPAHAQTWLSVTASSTTAGAATVTWTTAVPSDSQVEYGSTAAYGNFSALASTRITAHSVALSGLTAGTTYHFRVRSSDATGVLVIGGDNTLATASAVTISVSPLTANLAASGTQQFTATVSNTPNTAVLWSAKGGNGYDLRPVHRDCRGNDWDGHGRQSGRSHEECVSNSANRCCASFEHNDVRRSDD